ncbi:hypothetical protein OV208_04070 [Corallococcus sp. bb12-1]|uniref:hypothetical protein n=1 Tax=Corallococcus sp. bb12-1 TaxID=2996784 RepID=UPI0022712D1A|nr:hypothetical protein [Corallococcus sp. bb12-1]MCY1040489.1 hypothetical protein [Corallococcus sp. bb12-1]
MNPRTLCILIALLAGVFAVGTAVWLAWPGPDLTSQADLLERPVHLDLEDSDAPDDDASAGALPPGIVVLSNGVQLPFEVPSNCRADTQASLSCTDLCDADDACPPGRVCARNRDYGFRECRLLRSFCDDTSECTSAETCHPVDTSASGLSLRRCTRLGLRGAGEKCSPSGPEPEDTCVPGLHCVQERCGTPCDVHASGTCTLGTECAANPFRVLGACIPSCRDRPCAQGQRCDKGYEGEVPVCQPFVGQACQDDAPCAANQDCLRGFAEPSLETQAFECRTRCSQEAPCARGLTCDAASGYCVQACAQDADCAAPERCHVLHPRSPERGCGVIAEGLPTILRR